MRPVSRRVARNASRLKFDVHILSKASIANIVFPLITIIPNCFDCISVVSSRTRFMNGSNPRTTPLTTLEPFNRTGTNVID